MLRCAKNANGVIIAMGRDEGQSGNYPSGSSDQSRKGVWCSWLVDDNNLPALSAIAGADEHAMRFKENALGDGLEARPDADVLASPKG